METQDLFAPKLQGPLIRYVVKIEFDGGTPCNIPRLGYGDGYGSYQKSGGKIVRVQFHQPMSANVAEIRTLITAIKSIQLPREFTQILIYGDSRVALNRCSFRVKPKLRGTDFGRAAESLFAICSQFANVKTNWRGREKSVKLFGH